MTAQTRKVLFVAYYFPPIAATGVMRPLNLSRQLLQYGWVPRILATDPGSALPFHVTDQKLLEVVPAEIQVVRVPHCDLRGQMLDLRDKVVRSLCKSRDGSEERREPDKDAAVRKGGVADAPRSRLLRAGKFIAEALLEYPDRQCFWYRPAVKALADLPAHERPEVVWATGGPWTGLLVGKRLAELWDIPFIADFRDPWYSHSSSPAIRRMNKKLERSVFSRAARVILNTEELNEHYRASYPEYAGKLLTMTNGFPAELEVMDYDYHKRRDETISFPLEICHFGTVYWMRMPTALFKAVDELVSQGTIDSSRLRLRFVGGWEPIDADCDWLATSLERKGILTREEPLPHRQCFREMTRAGVLLILQPDAPLQVPAKLYEYLAARRPIWVVGGEGATASLVRRHGLGNCCPNNVDAIKQVLISFLAEKPELVAPDPVSIAQFNYRVLAGKLAEVLDRVSAQTKQAEQYSAVAACRKEERNEG
jgi:hypothetical protein